MESKIQVAAGEITSVILHPLKTTLRHKNY